MSAAAETRFPELGQPYHARPELIAGLGKMATPKEVGKGTILFHQGDPVKGIYVLESGRVCLTMSEEGSKPMNYRQVGAGYILGLPATICDQPYSLTAEVTEPAKLVFVEQKRVVDFLRDHSDLCLYVVEILGHELTEMRRARAEASSTRKFPKAPQ